MDGPVSVTSPWGWNYTTEDIPRTSSTIKPRVNRKSLRECAATKGIRFEACDNIILRAINNKTKVRVSENLLKGLESRGASLEGALESLNDKLKKVALYTLTLEGDMIHTVPAG